MSACDKCGAKIRWVKTSGGKRFPLDVKPYMDGDYAVVGDELMGFDETLHDPLNRFQSHWDTCPFVK